MTEIIKIGIDQTVKIGIWDQIRIIENKITEGDIEEILELITMREVGVGLEKDNFQTVLKGTIEVVVVDLDQFQEQVLIEIGLDVISVESMIISQKTAQQQN